MAVKYILELLMNSVITFTLLHSVNAENNSGLGIVSGCGWDRSMLFCDQERCQVGV